MPYGQYENTSFNGQTFTLGNVGLTGATGPNLVSSDPSKPVRVNGVIPGAGGGGGGDVFTNNPNTYDVGIVNTFQGNTVMTTVGASGKITCVALDAGAGKIETTADVECQGLNAGAVKIETTDNVECDTVVATANVQCVGVVASGAVSGATLTSAGAVNGVNVVASGGVSGATLTSSGAVNGVNVVASGGVSGATLTSAGDVVATSGTGIIHGNSILSEGNITCGPGSNFIVGSSQIASSNLSDGSLLLNTGGTAQTKAGALTASNLTSTTNVACGAGSNFLVGSSQIASSNLSDTATLLNTSATQQTKTGNLIVSQLTTSAGTLSFDTGGGANIQNNTGTNTLTTSTTNISDTLNWRLGTAGNDSLRLRYDANGGGSGIPRYFLEMLDPSTSPASYFQLSGNSGYDITALRALINSSSLTFNGATTTTFSAGSSVLLNGTTTVAAGTTDIGKSGVSYGVFGKLATLDDRSDTSLNPTRVTPALNSGLVASTGFLAPTYVHTRHGTNGTTAIYEVVLNGNVNKSTNWDGNGDQIIFTLPTGFRPAGRITYRAQGRGGASASRVDITTAGEVLFVDGGGTSTTYTELSLSGISFYAGI